MGIKNLSQFLRKREVYETLDISVLKYTKIGIDVPMFLFKFKGICDPATNDWLGCFITLIAFLRKHDIHPIFVFEGKAPPEKIPVQEERREQRQKLVDKTCSLIEDLNEYIGTGVVTPLLLQTWEKIKFKNNKSLLTKKPLTKSFINVEAIKDEISRRKRFEISITSEDINNLKELLDLMGVSWIQSRGEAETDCVSLFYGGIIDYIVSEDTDVLAYFNRKQENETKVIISFNMHDLTFVQISKQKVLNTLNLTSESFRDFCIMCGTDYNKNIFRVGTETAYKFITDRYNIENVPLDTTILNHIRVRELFKAKPNLKLHDRVKWCRLPESNFVDELGMYVFVHHIKNIDVNYVFKVMTETDLEIELEE
jgi:5'-3' exonuclease